MGLVVMGARIDARIVTEACCDVVQFSGTRETMVVHEVTT